MQCTCHNGSLSCEQKNGVMPTPAPELICPKEKPDTGSRCVHPKQVCDYMMETCHGKTEPKFRATCMNEFWNVNQLHDCSGGGSGYNPGSNGGGGGNIPSNGGFGGNIP